MDAISETEELRIALERLRTLLETLVVRGLRACGPDELTPLQSHAEHLAQVGAGHLSAVLSELHDQIAGDRPTSPRKLLEAQTNVRLLERLLTLEVVREEYRAVAEGPGDGEPEDGDEDFEDDEEGEET